jgi:hypothetical protein
MKTPTPEQTARARAIVARKSRAEIVALAGNWRPLKAPPLLEFVQACLIVDKESGSLIPFRLWPAQQKALEVIASTDKLIIPKGRQVGITTLELAYMLWAGTFFSHRLFPIARQSDDYAREAITRLLVLAGYDPTCEPGKLRVLPESLMPQQWRPRIAGKTKRELTLQNGSLFRALTATQPIARGLAAYMGLADEFAFWRWPAKQLAAMESGCARLHIVSTGNGADDHFAALYENAKAGRGAYKTLFIPSSADPRRTPEWYRINVEEAADPDSARREHARSVQDAFRSAEGVFFKKFSFERNVAEVAIVANWETFRAIDFGLRHAACLWVQRSPEGQLFIVDELLTCDLTTPEFAEAIKAHEAPFKLVEPSLVSYCDPAGKTGNLQTSKTEFDVFAKAGLRPYGKTSKVREGCVRIMNLLAQEEQPLLIASRCEGLIRAISQVKPHRANHEIYDKDHETFSHPLDALRYLLVSGVSEAGPQTVSFSADAPSALELLERAGRRSLTQEW